MLRSIMPPIFKPPRLDGLSQRLLASNYENKHGGAVRRLNAIDHAHDDAGKLAKGLRAALDHVNAAKG